MREQFGSLGVQIITITDVSGVWDTAQSGHSQRPHLTTAIRQSPTLLPVYPPTRGQQGGHVTRYPPIRESLHIIDSLGSLQHIHHQSPAEKMRQNIQTCMKSCLLQFVEPFLHEYEY